MNHSRCGVVANISNTMQAVDLPCKPAIGSKLRSISSPPPHATFHGMKTPKKGQQAPITTPLLKELVKRAKANFQIQNASISDVSLSQSASLFEDAGGGYNSNFVFPQD
jgi:hypothetical protein